MTARTYQLAPERDGNWYAVMNTLISIFRPSMTANIGVGGLLLARVPIEIVEERNEYYRGMTQNQMAAVDNDLAREQHPAMPISKPDRQSRVTFGGPQKEGD